MKNPKPPYEMTMADFVTKSADQLRKMFRANLQKYFTLPMWVYPIMPDELKKIYWEEYAGAGFDWYYNEYKNQSKEDREENRFIVKEMVKYAPELIKEDFHGIRAQYKSDNGEEMEIQKRYLRILKPILQ